MKHIIEWEIRNYKQRLFNVENVTLDKDKKQELKTRYQNGLELQEGLLKRYIAAHEEEKVEENTTST